MDAVFWAGGNTDDGIRNNPNYRSHTETIQAD